MTLPPIRPGVPTPSPEPESEGVGGPAQGSAPSKGPQLEKEVLALFNPSFTDPQFKGIIDKIKTESPDIDLEENSALLFTDFKEISDKIWLKLTEANPELTVERDNFISNNVYKFNQISDGKNWNFLKAELKEKMGGNGLTKEKLKGSWDGFRWDFVDKVKELGNLALNSMGISPIEGLALGTNNWKSDIDWEILPPPGMSETHHMLAKLILDVIATHLLGGQSKESVGRSAGEVLDLEFYTQHYAATEEDFFSQLKNPDSKNKFRMQELTMATLQQIRAGDMGAWKKYKEGTLEELNTGSGLRKVMQGIFENVEAFENLLEKEIHEQMFFESKALEPEGKAGLGPLWLEAREFSSDDFKDKTSIIGEKDSEKYKLAKNTLKADRLMHLSQMIDKDNQKAEKIQQEIETKKKALTCLEPRKLNDESTVDQQTSPMKLIESFTQKQTEYEKTILEASFKLAIRTSFFEGAIYTRTGYLCTVEEGQKIERAAEAALKERRGSDTSTHSGGSSAHSIRHSALRERRGSIVDARCLVAAGAEEGAQRRGSVHQLLEKAKKAPTPEKKANLQRTAVIQASKYALRELDSGSSARKEFRREDSEGEGLRYKTSELEKCKRKTVLSQAGFEGLLKPELERLKEQDIDTTVKELESLKAENIKEVKIELQRLKKQNIGSILEGAKALFEKGGVLYDEGSEEIFKLSPEEKYKILTAFLAGKTSSVAQSKAGAYLVEDSKIKLILSCKVGQADPNDDKVQKLFEEADQVTLEKLGLNTREGPSNYFKALDRDNLDALKETFKDIDLRITDLPDLMEIWKSTKR